MYCGAWMYVAMIPEFCAHSQLLASNKSTESYRVTYW